MTSTPSPTSPIHSQSNHATPTPTPPNPRYAPPTSSPPPPNPAFPNSHPIPNTNPNPNPKVQELQIMFPTIDPAVIEIILESCGGSQDRAIESLLSMTDPEFRPEEGVGMGREEDVSVSFVGAWSILEEGAVSFWECTEGGLLRGLASREEEFAVLCRSGVRCLQSLSHTFPLP